MSKSRLTSGRIKKATGDKLTVERYSYLDPSQSEPDLGSPTIGGGLLLGSTTTNVRTWSDNIIADNQTVRILSTLSNLGFTSSNALMVAGGVSIDGFLNVAGKAYLNNAEVLTTQSGLTSELGYILVSQQLVISTSTNSTSTTTGALIVAGGVGIGADVWVGGNLKVSGGAGIEGALVVTTASISTLAATFITAGTDTAVSTSTGGITIWSTGTLQSITERGSSTTYAINIVNTTQSYGTDTGALIVGGGIGVDGNLYVGGDLNVKGSFVVTTASILQFTELSFQDVTSYGSSTNRVVTITNTTTSTGTDTGALIVTGGVGIGGDIYAGNVYSNGTLIGATTGTTGTFFINNNTISTSTTSGALIVTGGVGIGESVYIGNTLTVSSTLSSTSSIYDNAFYVAGGVGIGKSLFVTGETLFLNNVTFAGTTTYILTTNTVYSDNMIELHYPNTPGNTWSVSDGKDVGFRFHYYDTEDRNAFLGRDNGTGYLEWISSGVEDNTSTVSGDFGTFKTGSIILTNTTASESTNTGALIVKGGVGIGGSVHIQGQLFIGGESVGNGYTGSAGINGYSGSTGQIGYVGSSGAATYMGYSGSQGNIGYIGSVGYVGSGGSGYTGSSAPGYTGSSGAFAARGYTGSSGAGAGGDAASYMTLYQAGSLVQTTGSLKWYAPYYLNIVRVKTKIGTTSSGILNVIINKNSIPVTTIAIAAGQLTGSNYTTPIVMSEDDYLTVDVDRPNTSTTIPTNLYVLFKYQPA